LAVQTVCPAQPFDANHNAGEHEAADGRCNQQNADEPERPEDNVRERRLMNGLFDNTDDDRRGRLREHGIPILRLPQNVAFLPATAFICFSPR